MSISDDLRVLPEDLPQAEDDGACDHLPGVELPPLALPVFYPVFPPDKNAGEVIDWLSQNKPKNKESR